MQKLVLFIALFLSCAFVFAQDQLTNFGSFQTFTNASLTFFGNFKNNGVFTDDGLTTSFKGASDQSILGTSVTTLKNFVVVSGSSSVILSQNLIVSNSLVLTSGKLSLNSKTLTITNNAGTALTRTGGYLLSEQVNNSGKVIWAVGTNTAAHVFPFCSAAAVYIPLSLTVTAGDIGNVTVSTYPTAADNTPYPISPVAVTHVNAGAIDNSANVVDRFWQVDKDGPSGTATLIFTATAAEIGALTMLRAQRWNSSTSFWDDALPGQSSTATSATVPGVTTFSPWTLSGNSSPLPMELVNFTAKMKNMNVALNWETSSELNNDYFMVQRSVDGNNFSDIGKVKGAGNSKRILNYIFVDTKPFNGRSYYRLTQTDFDGTYELSQVRTINFSIIPHFEFIAFPNPVKENKFSIDFENTADKDIEIVLYNLLGQIIYNNTIKAGVTHYEVNLTSNPPAGMYLLKALGEEFSAEQILMID